MSHFQHATLIMESRGLAPHVRSFSFSDSWSRLYRTERYFVDVSCHPHNSYVNLQGQLLTTSGEETEFSGKISLLDANDKELASCEIDPLGHFDLSYHEAGSYTVFVKVNQDTIKLSDFSLH